MKLTIESNMAKMPRSCHECPLGFGGFCDWAPAEEDGLCPDEGMPEWCPMHEAQDDGGGRRAVEPAVPGAGDRACG